MFSKIVQSPSSPPKSYDRIDLSDCRSIETDIVDGNFLDIGDRQQLPGFVIQDKEGTSYRFVARSRQEQATWLSTVQAFLNQNNLSNASDAKRKSPHARNPEFDAGMHATTVSGLLEEELGQSQNWLVASGYSEDVLAELTALRAQVQELEEDKRSLQLALSVALERMASWTTSLFAPLSQPPPMSQAPPSQPAQEPKSGLAASGPWTKHDLSGTVQAAKEKEGSEAGSGDEESGDRFEPDSTLLSPSRVVSQDRRSRGSTTSPEPSTLLSPHLNISPLNSSREQRPASPCGSFKSTSTHHSHGSRCKYA